MKEAGDGTTTATVLAHSLLEKANQALNDENTSIRELKEGIQRAAKKVNTYIEKTAIPVKNSMLNQVAVISCNNDEALGSKIGQAFEKVGKDGVVLMEE